MGKILAWISDHLLVLVLGVVVFSLIVPGCGILIGGLSMPLLAVMVLCVSMTIKAEDLKIIKKNPLLILLAAVLQFVPILLFSFVLGKTFLNGDFTTGQILLGSLPADISAPLMVCMVGGSTALATAMLVFQMILTPLILPFAVSALTGLRFVVPVSYLVVELSCIIILPVLLGIFLNSRSVRVRNSRQSLLGASSVCYLGLLLIVVSVNAQSILSLKADALVFLAVEVLLNALGYCIAFLMKRALKNNGNFYALLFLVSSKEFGITSSASGLMGLSPAVNIPSAFFAVVQMVLMPLAVKFIHSRQLRKTQTSQ